MKVYRFKNCIINLEHLVLIEVKKDKISLEFSHGGRMVAHYESEKEMEESFDEMYEHLTLLEEREK